MVFLKNSKNIKGNLNMRRVLLTDNPKLGALSDFIELLNTLQDKFKLQTMTIGSTDTDNRNMYAELSGSLGVLKLDYKYYDEEFYISVATNDEGSEEIERMIKVIKEFVERKEEVFRDESLFL